MKNQDKFDGDAIDIGDVLLESSSRFKWKDGGAYAKRRCYDLMTTAI